MSKIPRLVLVVPGEPGASPKYIVSLRASLPEGLVQGDVRGIPKEVLAAAKEFLENRESNPFNLRAMPLSWARLLHEGSYDDYGWFAPVARRLPE